MPQPYSNERGFTLIELLVVTATLSVLTTLSIQIYDLYKIRAYDAISDRMLNRVKVAVEAGRIEEALTNPPDWRFVQITEPGSPQPQAAEFLPGFMNDTNVVVWVERNGLCELGLAGEWCITEWIDVRHCKGNTWKSWRRLRNGQEDFWEWQVAFPC